jgi:hypothetical protein
LKRSKTIITKGLSASGLTLLDHSGLAVHAWRPAGPRHKIRLFDRPGELLWDVPYDQLATGDDFKAWLVGARGMTFDEFLSANDEAQAAAREALREVEGAAEQLAPEDLRYLTAIFEDAILMIESIRRIAAGMHAAQRHSRDPGEGLRRELDAACAALEEMADRIEAERGMNFFETKPFFKTRFEGKEYTRYGAPIGLRGLAREYGVPADGTNP